MTTETTTIETVYGDIEVETVDCDSCGATIKKENAKEFTIGERGGWACGICEETGPISFPGPVSFGGNAITQGIMMYPLTFLLSAAIATEAHSVDIKYDKQYPMGFLAGVIGTLLWLSGALVAYFVF